MLSVRIRVDVPDNYEPDAIRFLGFKVHSNDQPL
jgi:hypothetical protein